MTPKKLDRAGLIWAGTIAVTLLCLALQRQLPWLAVYPEAWTLPLSPWLNAGMRAVVDSVGWIFLGISWLLEWPIAAVRWVLQALPWAATVALFCAAGYGAGGWRLLAFTLAACLYTVGIGYWTEAMNTAALVAISVPMAIAVGFGVGVWGYASTRAERVIRPTLDILQTVPAFAYLLPILMLFGFGTVVGLIASVLYSFPPMVRNTMLGLRRVSPEVIESGLMSGATPWQLFWRVRVPSARKQLLLGANQSTMASLSMVIIASIIGGTADIGWEVLSTIRKAQFGESLLAGLVIALMAMVIDRVTAGYAQRSSDAGEGNVRLLLWAGGAAVALVLASFAIEGLRAWPSDLVWDPAPAMNEALTNFVVAYRTQIEGIKTLAFFFVMLPVKIGFQGAVSPFTWGFALQDWHVWLYAAVVAGTAGWCVWTRRQGLAVVIALGTILLYTGLTKMPWPAMLLICAVLAGQVGGARLALGTTLGLGFLVVTGIWEETMLSVYLCAIAVALSFGIGSAIGIWAARNETVSAAVRPVNDTLQTMPLFVILIPFVMVFKIGEFTALLAIMAYAIVPAIRYAELGLRGVPEDAVEAATMMGATRRQLLWQVRLPLALPVLMLGLNQTIMYAIAMLVIAALVGTTGLEQQVYIGLSDGDFGVGITAGIGMAIIAMIADRMSQAWSRKQQAALGL